MDLWLKLEMFNLETLILSPMTSDVLVQADLEITSMLNLIIPPTKEVH